MRYPLPDLRVVRGADSFTLAHQFTDADGEPAAPSATATVVVTRSDGTAVTSAAVGGTGTAVRTSVIAAAELTVVDRFSAAWTVSGSVVAVDTIDVVGGVIGSLTAIKAAEASLAAETDPVLLRARRAAEDRFISTQGRSPVQRLYVQRFDGTGRTHLNYAHFPDLGGVRWARIYSDATTYTTLTAAELSAVHTPDTMAKFDRLDGNVWAYGRQNIEIGYVMGLADLPTGLREAFFGAIRAEVVRTNTGIPDKAVGFGSIDGFNFQIATPGQRGAIYGIADIDDVFNKHRDPRPMVG